jgi:hypothetical protein
MIGKSVRRNLLKKYRRRGENSINTDLRKPYQGVNWTERLQAEFRIGIFRRIRKIAKSDY